VPNATETLPTNRSRFDRWREHLLLFYSVIGSLLFGIFAVILILLDRHLAGLGCALGMLLMLSNAIVWRKYRYQLIPVSFFIFIGGLGILWAIVMDPHSPSTYYWSLFFAPIPFFVLGHKRGSIFSMVFFLAILPLAFRTQQHLTWTGEGPLFIFRYILALVGALTFAYLFELARHRHRIKLQRQMEKNRKITRALKQSMEEIKVLSGFLPICAHCKKIRDDQGYWTQLEEYITTNSEAVFSHGICETCAMEVFGIDVTKAYPPLPWGMPWHALPSSVRACRGVPS